MVLSTLLMLKTCNCSNASAINANANSAINIILKYKWSLTVIQPRSLVTRIQICIWNAWIVCYCSRYFSFSILTLCWRLEGHLAYKIFCFRSVSMHMSVCICTCLHLYARIHTALHRSHYEWAFTLQLWDFASEELAIDVPTSFHPETCIITSADKCNVPPTCRLLDGCFVEADGDRVGRCRWWLCLRLSCGRLPAVGPNEWFDDDDEWCRGCIPASNDSADWNRNKTNQSHDSF